MLNRLKNTFSNLMPHFGRKMVVYRHVWVDGTYGVYVSRNQNEFDALTDHLLTVVEFEPTHIFIRAARKGGGFEIVDRF